MIRKTISAILSALILLSSPGPLALSAFAGVIKGPGQVPSNAANPTLGSAGLGSPGAAADASANLNLSVPNGLDSALPAVDLPAFAPHAAAAAQTVSALTPVSAQAPARASQISPATAGREASAPASAAAAANEDQPAQPGVIGSAQQVAALGSHAGARFDGSLPGVNNAVVEGGMSVGPNGPADHRPGLAPAPSGPYKGGPAGPTQPYTLGKVGEIRHAVGQWLLYKLDLYEGLYNFPAWFGGWSKWLAIWPLYSQVLAMRKGNMFSTRHLTTESAPRPWTAKDDTRMSADGAHTDRRDAKIGQAGVAMSHNMPLDRIQPKAVDSPLLKVAEEFLPRRAFRFVSSVNSFFAAEIQFEVEGWFGSLFDTLNPIKIQAPAGYSSAGKTEIEIAPTQQAPNKKDGAGIPVYNNVEASAWNLNQVYGSKEEITRTLRTDGGKGAKLAIGEDGWLPLDPRYSTEDGGGVDLTGQARNIWALRSVFHLLFALEHNSIVVDLLKYIQDGPPKDNGWLAFLDRKNREDLWKAAKAEYEGLGSDEERQEWLFQKARIINSAQNAAMHTHEWTEDLLPNPVTKLGMEIDYFGLLGRGFKKWWYPKVWMHKAFGWLLKNDILSGLPGSKVQRWSAPYDLGQTFLKVYRMRELMRTIYRIFSFSTGEKREDIALRIMQGIATRRALKRHSLVDWVYSGGLNHPGDITLNNVTEELRHFTTMDGREVDMALMDILRDDERGFPRYNEYRRSLRLPVPRTMLELTSGDWETAQRLDKFYRRFVKEMWVKEQYVREHRQELEALYRANFAKQRGVPADKAPEPKLQDLIVLGPQPTEQQVGEAPEPTDLEVVESVHAHIGLRASARMPGLVLSTDAYIVFTLNAPDRFAGNRFLSEQFDFNTYTWLGVQRTLDFSFKTLILRHLPELELALDGRVSGFMPFNRLHPQLDEKVDAQEKEMGIVTHGLDSIAGMGPRALNALYENSAAVTMLPGVRSQSTVIVRKGTRLGGLLSGLANTFVPSSFLGGELRQVGPTIYLGRSPIGYYALDFAPPAEKPIPGYQELSDKVERSALKLIKTAFLLASLVLALGVITGTALAFWPVALLGASLGLQATALLTHNAGRGSWKAALGATGMGEEGALNGLRHLNTVAPVNDRRGGRLSLAAVASAAAAFIAVALPAGLPYALAAAALGASFLAVGLVRKGVLARNIENLRLSLYSIIKKGRPDRDPSTLPGSSDLERHARFYSEGNPVGRFGDMRRNMKRLGLPAFFTTLSSALFFSGPTHVALTSAERAQHEVGRFDIYMPNIKAARNPGDTGIYGPDGNVNRAYFDGLFDNFGTQDAATGEKYITAKDGARFREWVRAQSTQNGVSPFWAWIGSLTTKRRFAQLFKLAPDRLVWEDGKLVPAIGREQALKFYQGSLQPDLAQERSKPLMGAPLPAPGTLPDGAWKGKTEVTKGRDVMSLQLRPDPKERGAYYAVLSEYKRIGLLPSWIPERLQITHWVPQMHIYRAVHAGDNRFEMRPLSVSAGELAQDTQARPSLLTLQDSGSLEGAVMTRYIEGSRDAERINFNGDKLISTWEPFVAGKWFLATSPIQYFQKGENTTTSEDRIVEFTLPDMKGKYEMVEKAPGIFAFKPVGDGHVGLEKVVNRIGVFIDIVNWKPVSNTNELLMIDPNDPKNVGFLYQRGKKPFGN